jgi:hypothetical protein
VWMLEAALSMDVGGGIKRECRRIQMSEAALSEVALRDVGS